MAVKAFIGRFLRMLSSYRSCKEAERNVEKIPPKITEYTNDLNNWVTTSNQKSIRIKNPINGEIVGCVPDLSVEDTEAILLSAKEALIPWQKTPFPERTNVLRRWYDLLLKNEKDIVKIMQSESGKSNFECVHNTKYKTSYVGWFSRELKVFFNEINNHLVDSKPDIGVKVFITPWNFPFSLITRTTYEVLAQGCTCVVRPAQNTPITALSVMQLAAKAGVPKGVMNVITCDQVNAATIGKLLCKSPHVAGIYFTSATVLGKIVYISNVHNMRY